jgi:hypothetical protein
MDPVLRHQHLGSFEGVSRQLEALYNALFVHGPLQLNSNGVSAGLRLAAEAELMTIVTTAGQIITSDGEVPMALDAGTNGQMLIADDEEEAGLKWVASPHTLITTPGQLLTYTSDGENGALAALTVGANGTVLIADDEEEAGLKWGTPAAPTFEFDITTQGDDATPSIITLVRKDATGAVIATPFIARVRICDDGDYEGATDAEIASGDVGTVLLETITADKDLVLQSDENGVLTLEVTDATTAGFTIRVGPYLSSPHADYSATLDGAHAEAPGE